MKLFSEWSLNFVPTIILMILVIVALLSSQSWVLQGFMKIMTTTNIMTGFFSHITKVVGFIAGGH